MTPLLLAVMRDTLEIKVSDMHIIDQPKDIQAQFIKHLHKTQVFPV
jgi:hypothetical protein